MLVVAFCFILTVLLLLLTWFKIPCLTHPCGTVYIYAQTKEKNKNSLSGIVAVVLDWKELSHETMGCIRAKQFLVSDLNFKIFKIILC